MNAHRIETTLSQDRTLTLLDLPFKPGASIEVIILETLKSDDDAFRYPLRGTPYRFDSPFEPVAAGEWEAAK